MSDDSNAREGKVIDLDPDQVIEQIEPKPDEKPAPVARKRVVKRGWYLGAAALLAAAVAGGWFYRDVLANYFPSDQTAALLDKTALLERDNGELRQKLGSIEKLVTELNGSVDGLQSKQSSLSEAAGAFDKRLSDTDGKLGPLEQSIADTKKTLSELAARPVATTGGTATSVDASVLASLQSRIETLEKDIASFKASAAQGQNETAALSQGLSDLKAKIASGAPFADEFGRIQRMVPAAEGLDVLKTHAATGLPDSKGLAEELVKLAETLPKPAAPEAAPQDDGFWASLGETMSDLITIRVAGETDWPAAATSAAELARAGDLQQATDQLGAVEGARPAGVQQWLERAQARLAMDKATRSVEDAVMRVIAAKG